MPTHERRRRLLIVSYYFPPCAAVAVHRVLGFAKHLPGNGWDVSVIAPTTDKWEATDEALLSRVPKQTDVVRIDHPNNVLSRLANRYFPYETWQVRSWRQICQHVRDWQPDVVLTTSPPDSVHIIGHRLKRRFGLPWIADLRDPWVLSQSKVRRQGLRGQVAIRTAHLTMANADFVAVNTPSYARRLSEIFPKHKDKIGVFTNGHDGSVTLPPSSPVSISKPVTLLHAGEIYAERDPRPVLTAIQRLAREEGSPGVRFVLMGRWSEAQFDLPGAIRAAGIEDRVDLIAQVPHKQAIEAMQSSDILVLLQLDDSPSIPAKLYEYISIGKPILALANPRSDIGWVLETSGVTHRLVAPKDTDGVMRAIRDLVTAIRNGNVKTASADRIAMFSRAQVAARLAAKMETLVASEQAQQKLNVGA